MSEMAFVSVTRLRIRANRYLLPFFWHAFRSQMQAKRAPGNLAIKVHNDAHRTFWTLTGWTDEAAMRNFMISGPHKRVMPKLLNWCDEASLGHWTQESNELPDWKEAHRRMVAIGRASKVRNPSPDHLARRIAEPRV